MADELEQACTSYLTSVLRGTSRKHDGTEAAAPAPEEDEVDGAPDTEQEANMTWTLYDTS